MGMSHYCGAVDDVVGYNKMMVYCNCHYMAGSYSVVVCCIGLWLSDLHGMRRYHDLFHNVSICVACLALLFVLRVMRLFQPVGR